MATSNGQFFLPPEVAQSFLPSLLVSHLPGQRPESRDHLPTGGDRAWLPVRGNQGAAPFHAQIRVWVQNGTGMAEGVRMGDPSGSTPSGSQNGPPYVYEDNPAGRYDIKHH